MSTSNRVAALINRAGLKAEAYEDLLPHQWSKLIFNSAVNSISALTDLPHVKAFAVEDNLEDLGHLVYAMMDEAKRIANARGVTLADDPWEMNVNAGKTRVIPAAKTTPTFPPCWMTCVTNA